MQRIPLSLARPGMVLAKPVLRENGLVLVAENSSLSESLLERLERMEIGMVTVQGHPVDLGDSGENPYSMRLKRLDHLFRRHGQDAWMQKVLEHVRQYLLIKSASASGAASSGNTSGGEA